MPEQVRRCEFNPGDIIDGRYQVERILGEGTFGKVKLSVHLLTNEYVAIKILEKSRITDKEIGRAHV